MLNQVQKTMNGKVMVLVYEGQGRLLATEFLEQILQLRWRRQ
jgi:hypothetical protein